MNNKELIEKYVPYSLQKEAFKKLEEGYPVQYIIGNVDFLDSIIEVNENVLIPRFETELLVDKTIKYAKKIFNKKINIIELCTGSGCIAISLKKALESDVTAVDISAVALEVAKKNAQNNNVEINFKLHDINNIFPGKYDLLISNPPYISYNSYVEEQVLNYEPHIALFASDNGLHFYKKILSYADSILNEKSLIAFEIGDNQKELLEAFLKEEYPNKKYSFEVDLTNRYRYLFIFNE